MYEVFSELLQKNNVKAADVAKATGISTGSLSDWKASRSTPKQDKLLKIADYFGVTVDYLMGVERDKSIKYYLNEETAAIAQEVFENKDLKLLFDASRNARPEDIRLAAEMLQRMKDKENYKE